MASKNLDVRIKNKYDDIANYQQSNIVLMQGEIAFCKDNNDYSLYVGDGVTAFNDLTPLYSTKYVVGVDKMEMQVVKLQPNAWVNKEQVVDVPGVVTEEESQLIIPTYSQASRNACISAGLDFYVKANGQIAFTVNIVPTEVLTVFVGIFGARNVDNDKPIVMTNVDDVLSDISENPVMNKVITKKIDSIEATIRSITGDSEENEELLPLPVITQKVENVTNYSETPVLIGTYINNNDVTKVTIPFSVTVSRESIVSDSDIAFIGINHTLTLTSLAHCNWCAKASTNEFFSSATLHIDNVGKIYIGGFPLYDEEYTLTGIVNIEYVA